MTQSVKHPKMYKVIKQRKAANPHIREAENSKSLAFLSTLAAPLWPHHSGVFLSLLTLTAKHSLYRRTYS